MFHLYSFWSRTVLCISRSIIIINPNKSNPKHKGTWVFLAFGLTSFMLLVLIHYRLRRKFVERTKSKEAWFKSCLIISIMNCCAYGQMGAFALSASNEEFFVWRLLLHLEIQYHIISCFCFTSYCPTARLLSYSWVTTWTPSFQHK